MEDIIKALLDVVRAQHSAAEGTEETPFNMDDIVDMAMNIVGRPDESEEAEMVDSIQKMVEMLAPDIFPPKTFEEMDDVERAASAANMIEERLKRGTGRNQVAEEQENRESNQEMDTASSLEKQPEVVTETPSFSEQASDEKSLGEEVEEREGTDTEEDGFDAQQTADLNDLIYKNLMEMMGLQNPQVEYPFDRSQIQYGREKTVTEMLEEEKQQEEEKIEPEIPQETEKRETKSASQLATEAIQRAQEADKEKLEIEKQAERLMEEAQKRGQDPMKFALHQQEILRYMEKNSDELVSFEDYEDLSPEEKLEIERQMHIEKQLEEGVHPDEVDREVPEEFIPEEMKKTEEAKETADTVSQPVLTEEMLRQLSQEVLRENSDMILSENENEDMDSLNEAIFENIKQMMRGSGAPVQQENVEDLLQQAAQMARNEEESSENSAITEENPVPEMTKKTEAQEALEEAESMKGLSAVELAMAAQRAARPEPKEVKEGKSAVELAREAQEKAKKAKIEAEQKTDAEEIPEKEPEQQTQEPLRKEEEPEKLFEDIEQEEEEKTEQKTETTEKEPEKIMTGESEKELEKIMTEEPEKEPEEEYEYVAPDELVLGEHTQAEIDEALENLNSLGLEGDVYERAKRMLLLELAGSEAELDAWLDAQKNGKKKKASVSALDGEDLLDLEDLDEDRLEQELELAMDEDFLNDDLDEETLEEEKEEKEEKEENSEEAAKEESNQPEEKIEKEDKNEQQSGEEEHVKPNSTKKRVIKKKEKKVTKESAEKPIEEYHEAEQKGYQVSLRHPFILKNSASFMDQFEEYIMDTQENRKLSTGFKKLDAMLRYGLHKGSYFIDSEPQYLKNSFMQQMADRAAESGVDVLYISTELSRYDLMVDTISRLSYEIHEGDLNKAVSVMSIMTGEDGAEISALKDELNWYRGRISEHLYILDQEAVTEYTDSMEEVSAGDILAELIRSIVKEGAHKPVIFIDNIANILSVEDSEDMKPLMDGIRQLAKELSIPIIMSYGYAQAENETELTQAQKEFHESLGMMCDVYMELRYADMITEDSVELSEEDIREMMEDGEELLIDVLLHRNRRPMRASCQIQATPKFNYFEE